jgi:hypothetical protein
VSLRCEELEGRVMMAANSFGLPIQVNASALVGPSTGSMPVARVAMDAAGDFVEVWSAPATQANSYDIYARLYDASGNAKSTAIQVNDPSQPAKSTLLPALTTAMDAAGDFVVAWNDQVIDPTTSATIDRVEARTFNAQGQDPLGQFNVTNSGSLDSVAMDAAGDFVIVWTGVVTSTNNMTAQGIQGELYGADRTALRSFTAATSSLTVTPNSYSFTNLFNIQAAMNAKGDFVVGYESSTTTISNQSTNGSSASFSPFSYSTSSLLQAQEYDAQGNPGRLVTLANKSGWFSVGIDGQENLVAVTGTGTGLTGQRFDSAGNPLGSPFQVNTGGDVAVNPALAVADSGAFAVAWESFPASSTTTSSSTSSNSSTYTLNARRFDANGNGEPQPSPVVSLSQTSMSGSIPSVALNDAGGLVVGWSTTHYVPSPNATSFMSGPYVYYSSYTSVSNVFAGLLGAATTNTTTSRVQSLTISPPLGTVASTESSPQTPAPVVASPVQSPPIPSGSFSPIDTLAQQLAQILTQGSQSSGLGTSGAAPALRLDQATITPSLPTNVPYASAQVAADGGSPEQPTIIAGKVFLDYNGNGMPDQGEPGVAGQTVYLDSKSDGRFEPEKRFAVTDEKGEYQFRDLRPGIYVVRQVQRTYLRQTSPPGNAGREVSLSQGRRMVLDQDFGAVIIRPRKSQPVVVEDSPIDADDKAGDTGALKLDELDLNLDSRLDKRSRNDEPAEDREPTLMSGWMAAAVGLVLWHRPNRSKKSTRRGTSDEVYPCR